MSSIRFIPAQALSSKKAFASYMGGDPGFAGFSPGGTVSPYVADERMTRDEWVSFGEGNLWPERWMELVENCIPLARCTEIGKLFIAGSGVQFVNKENKEIPEAQDRFQEWVSETSEEEWLERTASDIAVFNAWAYDCTPLGDEGRRVGRIRHRDTMRVRLGKADDKGVIRDTFWSADWIQAMRKSRAQSAEIYAPRKKPLLDLAKRQPIATGYVKGYKQGKDYYGEPWAISAITDAENHVEVGRFNNSQLKTGFRGALHMHYTTDLDEKKLDSLYDKLVANYVGSMGDGLFITFGREGEPVEITPIERGDHAGELDEMRVKAEKAVVTAYGIPPIVYGFDDVNTGMDGAGQAQQQAFEKFQRTWVEPRQKLITRELTKLMLADGIEVWDTVIKPLQVIDPKSDEVQDRQAYMRAVTVDEHRVTRLGIEELGGEEGKKLLIAAGSQPADASPTAAP